jgi:hypothetical protein
LSLEQVGWCLQPRSLVYGKQGKELTCIRKQEPEANLKPKSGYTPNGEEKTGKPSLIEQLKQEIFNQVKYKPGINPLFVSTSTKK